MVSVKNCPPWRRPVHVFTYLWIPPAHSLEKEPASIPERDCRAERCFGKYGPRVLGLLGCVGAVKSAKYVGTRVLPLEKATENSDFTNPVFRRRLVDMMESFQILALSCRETCVLTLSSLDAHAIELIRRKLKIQKERKRGEPLSFQMMDIIIKYAPFQTIRSVYSELQQQFFWANAFHGMIGSQDTVNAVYGPYMDVFIEALEKTDFLRFSEELEALMIYEFRKTAGFMSKIGIPGTETIWIPKPCV